MKKTLKAFIILLLMLVFLTGCGESEKHDANDDKKMTSEEIVTKLKEQNKNVGRIVTYTEETDINELLGRPNQYTSKTTFEDTRIEQTNQNLDEQYFSEEERNEPIGGTVEVFKNEADMKKRKDYLETITSSMSVFAEYSYAQGVYLLRLNKSLTPAQAKEYEENFYKIINEK